MLTKLEIKMKGILLHFSTGLIMLVFMTGCGNLVKSKKTAVSDGQVKGAEIGGKYIFTKPYGMVYIPAGTFHMGPSDEDISASYTSKNKQVSMNDFWMDATEITNNEYRQFVLWVRDSIAATVLNYTKQTPDGSSYIDWAKVRTIKWNDPKMQEQLSAMIITPDNRINGRKELDVRKLQYRIESFDLKEAARRENANMPRGSFIQRDSTPIYPDTLVWIRDFSYSYNEPYAKKYFSHPAYGNYPVVGVSWKQANAFCSWRSQYLNSFLESKGRVQESDFRLPTEAQWEYAARGGRSQVPYPWGGPYLRNKKGCLLANFKPGRGNYPEDGGLYTVRADAYWPNDFGLYNMAGNVAEWTSSLYYEGAYNFQHDMNPDIRYNALDSDPPRMKRKVVRGGSWKDIGYFLQNSTRAYEYQDTAKSYIGFRCVIDLPPMAKK
jgi:gliding motility-associated lipoprotein GldK